MACDWEEAELSQDELIKGIARRAVRWIGGKQLRGRSLAAGEGRFLGVIIGLLFSDECQETGTLKGTEASGVALWFGRLLANRTQSSSRKQYRNIRNGT